MTIAYLEGDDVVRNRSWRSHVPLTRHFVKLRSRAQCKVDSCAYCWTILQLADRIVIIRILLTNTCLLRVSHSLPYNLSPLCLPPESLFAPSFRPDRSSDSRLDVQPVRA